MKRSLACIVLFCLAIFLEILTVLAAEQPIEVIIDGVRQRYDQPPILVNNRVLVPLRGIFEAIGAQIEWDDVTSTVTATKDGTVIKLTIGEKSASINGMDKVLDQESLLINSRTMVPVRFVSEALKCEVDWEENTQTVVILTQKSQGKSIADNVSESDLSVSNTSSTDVSSGNILDQNFNEVSDGNVPVGWTISTNGGTVCVEEQKAASDGKVLKLQKSDAQLLTTGTSFAKIQRGIIKVETGVMFTTADDVKQVIVKNDKGEDVQRVGFNLGAITAGQPPSSAVGLMDSYKANVWYNIRFEINLEQKCTDIYVNNVKKADKIRMLINTDNIAGIEYRMQNKSTGNMYVDFVKVSE